MKKKKPNIAKIALEFEINGGQMGDGRLGTNPNYIGRYLLAHKIKYSRYETLSKLEKNINKGDIFILSFWLKKDGAYSWKTYSEGLHTVAVKNTSATKFHNYEMYNESNDSTKVGEFNTIKEMLSKKTYICAYKLK